MFGESQNWLVHDRRSLTRWYPGRTRAGPRTPWRWRVSWQQLRTSTVETCLNHGFFTQKIRVKPANWPFHPTRWDLDLLVWNRNKAIVCGPQMAPGKIEETLVREADLKFKRSFFARHIAITFVTCQSRWFSRWFSSIKSPFKSLFYQMSLFL